MPSPTGTEAIRPVERTCMPSSIAMYSPMMMMPTRSLSRLKGDAHDAVIELD